MGAGNFGGCPQKLLLKTSENCPLGLGKPPAPRGWGPEAATRGCPRGLGGCGLPPVARGQVVANGGWGLPSSLIKRLLGGWLCHASDSVVGKSATGLGLVRDLNKTRPSLPNKF